MDINSHDKFFNTLEEKLGHDWSVAGNRRNPARTSNSVFLPKSALDVQKVVRQATTLTEDKARYKIRGMGHSDNDLVLPEDRENPVICTAFLKDVPKYIDGDLSSLSDAKRNEMQPGPVLVGSTHAWVGAGMEMGELEEALAPLGVGLKVRPDHDHISVGGICSAGGVSLSAHKYGLFVDTVDELLVVDLDGDLYRLSRQKKDPDFFKFLCGIGRHGVIVAAKLSLLKKNKKQSMLVSTTRPYIGAPSANRFLNDMVAMAKRSQKTDTSGTDPVDGLDDFAHVRGTWLRTPGPSMGFIATYKDIKGSDKAWEYRNNLMNELYEIGEIAGEFDENFGAVEQAVKSLGISSIINILLSSAQGKEQYKHLTYEDVETLTDRVLDTSVGGMGFMMAAFVPVDAYKRIWKAVQTAADNRIISRNPYKQDPSKNPTGLLSYAMYSRPIRSAYLSQLTDSNAKDRKQYMDMSLFAFLHPGRTIPPGERCSEMRGIREVLDREVRKHNAKSGDPILRYMVTFTKIGDGIRANPNELW